MSDFTTILKRGQRRFRDKYLKRRKFGKCDGCQSPALLIEYEDVNAPDRTEAVWKVCEFCYTELINNEDK
jgi:hypothetical protein